MEQHLPKRMPPGTDSFDTRPAQLEQWVSQLPALNVGETTRQLFSAVIEMNRLEISAAQRFKALELLRPSIRNVLEAMQKHYVGQPLPLQDKSRKVVELSEALLNQLATGYRICVVDEGAKNVFLKDKKLLAIAIHRALSHLGEVLLKAFQVYSPYPAGVWQNLHELYALAEERSLTHIRIKSERIEPGADTISGAYKQILLLALACPYRLRQGEVSQIYGALKQWSDLVSLEEFVEPKSPDQIFITSLESDDPPTYLVLRHHHYHRKNCRLLDTEKLSEAVRAELTALHKKAERATPLNESVLRRLMLSWGVMPKRKYHRSTYESSAIVAMGLSPIHYFISGDEAISPESHEQASPALQDRAHFSAGETREQRQEQPDVWDLKTTRRWKADESEVHKVDFVEEETMQPTPPAREEASVHAEYSTHIWKMVNVSAGGYCLLWDSKESTDAQVGELIGIRESKDPDSFHLALGIVRWMKSPDKGVELGVQMLSPGAVAVATQVVRKDREVGFMRSLLLPEIRQLSQPATLLTPSLPYQVGDTVNVNSHGKIARVQLTKLLENTGLFSQFQFTPLDENGDGQQDEAATRLSPEDFEALWKEI